MMQLRLKGTCNINLISVYLPPAERAIPKDKDKEKEKQKWEQDKEKVYQKLDEITSKTKGKGPTYIMGDFNARMQKHQNKEERRVFGKWTLEPEKTKVHELSEEVTWNRSRCIQYCLKHNLILSNTRFKKTKEKTATFRWPGIEINEEITHKNHEQIEYIAVQHRWKNSVLNAESDSKANIKSDHYPVIATIRIKLKARAKKIGPGRQKYMESTKEQKEIRNNRLLTQLIDRVNNADDIHTKSEIVRQILEESTKELPTIPKKRKRRSILRRN